MVTETASACRADAEPVRILFVREEFHAEAASGTDCEVHFGVSLKRTRIRKKASILTAAYGIITLGFCPT